MNINSHKICVLAFILFLGSLLPIRLYAQSPGSSSQIIINADQTDLTKNTYVLTGNVQVVFQGQHLTADSAIVDLEKKTIDATGNVTLVNPKVHAEGSRLKLNYETNTGTFYDAFIQSGQVLFEGQMINKISENEYVAIDGEYTACTTCPPGWSFKGQEIEAELGGYAYIKYPILKVGGFPIIILPRILVPLKSARQSGLLFPSMDYSGSGGLALSQSYFWAIARNKDLTYTIKHYEKRGWKSLADYRYVMSPRSRGRLQSAIIKDEAFRDQLNLNDIPYRWLVKYDHHFELPGDITHRAKLNLVSDLYYPRDFSVELEGHGDPALINRVSMTKNTKSQHFSADAMYYVNLLQANPMANNENAVHRFPELRYSLTERQVADTGVLFKTDVNYVNFTRSGFGYDDILEDTAACSKPGKTNLSRCVQDTRDGEFDPETDIIRTGQRLDIQPSLSYPFQIGEILDISPRLTYRETQYRFGIDEQVSTENYGPSAARRYVQGDLSMRTQFSRVFGSLDDVKGQRWKHEIEPEVLFSTIPWIQRPEHNFFGSFSGQRFSRSQEPISNDDFVGRNKVQFDYTDRVYDKRIVNFSLMNRLVRKVWAGDKPEYKTVARWQIAQSYDINETTRTSPQPWSAINSYLDLRLKNFETYTAASFYPYANVTNASSRIKLLDDRGDFIQFSYTNSYLVYAGDEVNLSSKAENWGLAVGLVSRYLNLVGQVDYSNITHKIQSWQYLAEIKPPGECWGFQIGHRQVINADIQFTFNFNFNFGGGKVAGFGSADILNQ